MDEQVSRHRIGEMVGVSGSGERRSIAVWRVLNTVGPIDLLICRQRAKPRVQAESGYKKENSSHYENIVKYDNNA